MENSEFRIPNSEFSRDRNVQSLFPCYRDCMQLPESVINLVAEPSTAAIWELRGDLLGLGLAPEAGCFELLTEFHRFLDRIATGESSRDYSERASLMEIGALSGVVASDLAHAEDAGEWAGRMLAAAFSEGLAVLSTRQHVKAWRGELGSVYREAAWFLYGRLWEWASLRKPELDPGARRLLLDHLLAPVRDDTVDADRKTVLLSSLFLLLIIESLAGESRE